MMLRLISTAFGRLIVRLIDLGFQIFGSSYRAILTYSERSLASFNECMQVRTHTNRIHQQGRPF